MLLLPAGGVVIEIPDPPLGGVAGGGVAELGAAVDRWVVVTLVWVVMGAGAEPVWMMTGAAGTGTTAGVAGVFTTVVLAGVGTGSTSVLLSQPQVARESAAAPTPMIMVKVNFVCMIKSPLKRRRCAGSDPPERSREPPGLKSERAIALYQPSSIS